MKNISILGSTGSIGKQTLEVISQYPERFRVLGLSAGENIGLLVEQIRKFRPEAVSVKDSGLADPCVPGIKEIPGSRFYTARTGRARSRRSDGTTWWYRPWWGRRVSSLHYRRSRRERTWRSRTRNRLSIAGEILTGEAEKKGVRIIPVDSEHSAIFQALETCGKEYAKRLIITASGGPFLNTPEDELGDVTVEVALNHPTWKMGDKITIDSATLMNKGFEVIEAKWLFGFDPERISVWIHPQSIVHSMVEYIDGSSDIADERS